MKGTFFIPPTRTLKFWSYRLMNFHKIMPLIIEDFWYYVMSASSSPETLTETTQVFSWKIWSKTQHVVDKSSLNKHMLQHSLVDLLFVVGSGMFNVYMQLGGIKFSIMSIFCSINRNYICVMIENKKEQEKEEHKRIENSRTWRNIQNYI